MARAIMLQGTGSDVGKTVLVAGLCRAARNRGMKVRPFKPQNMSNNAAVADIPGEAGGGEIGRAQWLQAIACGAAPSIHMNPVLLKPQSDIGSQVVVQGKVFGEAKARDYQLLKPKLMDAVLDSWAKVGEGADLVIVEGAGSPAEINLRPRDIANMGFATRANVPVVLVGDIDRGGVIASIAGTHLILPEDDRRMIVGYLINKFRGDVSLFDDGLAGDRKIHRLALLRRRAVAEGGGAAAVGGFGRPRKARRRREARAEDRRADAVAHRQFRRSRSAEGRAAGRGRVRAARQAAARGCRAGGHPRLEIDHRRPVALPRERLGPRPCRASAARRPCRRHLRRLPDARPHGARSRTASKAA